MEPCMSTDQLNGSQLQASLASSPHTPASLSQDLFQANPRHHLIYKDKHAFKKLCPGILRGHKTGMSLYGQGGWMGLTQWVLPLSLPCPFCLALWWVLLLLAVSGIIFSSSGLPTPTRSTFSLLHSPPLITTLVGLLKQVLLLIE